MKVGGHQRKPARNVGGGSGSNGGSGQDSWRLTAAQKITLAEAYSDEPGTKRYIPDAASGWKRQKSPWATGKVIRGFAGGALRGKAVEGRGGL